jgi:hypothetical protein
MNLRRRKFLRKLRLHQQRRNRSIMLCSLMRRRHRLRRHRNRKAVSRRNNGNPQVALSTRSRDGLRRHSLHRNHRLRRQPGEVRFNRHRRMLLTLRRMRSRQQEEAGRLR